MKIWNILSSNVVIFTLHGFVYYWAIFNSYKLTKLPKFVKRKNCICCGSSAQNGTLGHFGMDNWISGFDSMWLFLSKNVVYRQAIKLLLEDLLAKVTGETKRIVHSTLLNKTNSFKSDCIDNNEQQFECLIQDIIFEILILFLLANARHSFLVKICILPFF